MSTQVTADDREAQTTHTIALRVRRDDAKPVLSLQAIKARRGVPTKVLRATVAGDADAVLQVKVVADNGELTLPEAPPELVAELSQRYIKLYEMITGETFVVPPTDVDAGERIRGNVAAANL